MKHAPSLLAVLAWALVACDSPAAPDADEATKPAGAVRTAATTDRPNIVLIIGDDQAYRDSGFMGNALVKTPNLDRLAAEGTVFTTAYNSASACRPSLFTLLTGLSPYQLDRWKLRRTHMGHDRKDPNHILDLQTLPSLLGQRGYRSFQAGKHWEGSWRQAGFTAGTKSHDVKGLRMLRMSGGEEGLEVGRTTMQPVWDFLEDEAGEPFLLWFAPMLPHIPMDAPAEIRSRYAGTELAPSALAYYANITRLDDVVGQLIEKLRELSLLERTLVVYLSDNGWDNDPDVDHREGRARNIGGKRGKMSMHELGFRTPIIFRWPGRIPPDRVREELVTTADVFPTLLGYAGLAPPSGLEGIDLRRALETGAPLPDRTIYGFMGRALSPAVEETEPAWVRRKRPAFFARSPRWHYFRFPAVEGRSLAALTQLYDLRADPTEMNEVSNDHPDTAQRFQQEIEAWQRGIQNTLPGNQTRIGEWESRQP